MISEIQINKSGIISKVEDEKGMVLIGSIAILALIALVAGIAVTTTFTEIKISSNYKTSIQALYIGEAGVQRAKAELKTALFDDVLNGIYGGSPGILSFGANTAFANGTYNVTVQDNDDGDSNISDDSDDIVYIIGTGALPNGSKSSVELKILKTLIPMPPIPAPITIIGEADVVIDDSIDINVDGRDWQLTDTDMTGPTGPVPSKYAIALSNIGEGASLQTPGDAIADLDNEIADFQEANFVGTSTAYTESIGLDYDMTSQKLQDFADVAKQVADNSLMASDVPFSGAILESTSGPDNQITIGSQTIELGSVNNPMITYFNMKPEDNGGVDRLVDFQNDIAGSGILIIEGNDLIFREYLSWTGVIIVIGDMTGCGLMGDGSKEQTITGALIVDEQDTDHPNDLEVVLTGDANCHYSSEAVDLAQNLVFNNGAGNITMLTWRQLLN